MWWSSARPRRASITANSRSRGSKMATSGNLPSRWSWWTAQWLGRGGATPSSSPVVSATRVPRISSSVAEVGSGRGARWTASSRASAPTLVARCSVQARSVPSRRTKRIPYTEEQRPNRRSPLFGGPVDRSRGTTDLWTGPAGPSVLSTGGTIEEAAHTTAMRSRPLVRPSARRRHFAAGRCAGRPRRMAPRARRGIRTPTPLAGPAGLSRLRLPFRHPGRVPRG